MSALPAEETPAQRVRAEVGAGVFELEGARLLHGLGEGEAEAAVDAPGDQHLGSNGHVTEDATRIERFSPEAGTATADGLETEAVLATTDRPVPLWRQMLEVYVANRLALVSTILLLIVTVGCFVGPHLYVTNQTDANALLGQPLNAAPSSTHWLGTDGYGWDVLGRIMYAGQYSLVLGFLAGLVTIVVGTGYGMVAGFFGGVLDAVMMRVVDAALAIPYLFLLVALVTIFGNSTTFLLLVIGLTGWFGNSRIIRGDALAIRDLDYSLASISMGASRFFVIRKHVFRNSISNIVTVGTFSIADAILALSALGFIGFGLQQPAVDWGTMMSPAAGALVNGYWWEIYPVAATFVAVIICINYIGDALRDIFEVRLRQR